MAEKLTDLRVLIAANDPLARAGLTALLLNEEGVQVIGQVSPDTDGLAVFAHDVALVDLGWEPDEALTPLGETALLELDQPVVVLLPDDEHVMTVMATLSGEGRTAAYGLLVRNTPPGKLVAALNAVYEDLITVDPVLAERLQDIPQPGSGAEELVEPLTPRESEVLDLLAEGLPNKTIASRLTISEYTVKFHVNSILTKLGAGSRTEAVVRATRMGLITL